MSGMSGKSHNCDWIGFLLSAIDLSNCAHFAIFNKSYDSRFTSAGSKYYIISIGVFKEIIPIIYRLLTSRNVRGLSDELAAGTDLDFHTTCTNTKFGRLLL